jgi:hypothetical protein
MPDPIIEQEVAIDIDANATNAQPERSNTRRATIPDNEEVTVVAPKGRLAYGKSCIAITEKRLVWCVTRIDDVNEPLSLRRIGETAVLCSNDHCGSMG